MPDLPTGTVTFLFTDVERSTQLWEQHPTAMDAALARHNALAAAIIPEQSGTLVKHRGEGDSLFAVFARAADAVAAAVALQRALLAEPWPEAIPLRVRMALHTGDAALREADYFGPAVNRCARLRAIAHGGQVLLSGATQELVRDDLPPGASLRDLGLHRLRDLQRPEQVSQLLAPDLPGDFPPLRSLEAFRHNLSVQLTSFIGRQREMAEVKRLLGESRLLTLTGSGGCGKTRLALQVAADLLEEYADGVWLVELAALADPAFVPQTVAAALGVREEPNRPLAQTLLEYLRPKQVLLVLDNCEHLLAACAQLADPLLRGCPRLRILATSREGLGIVGEQTYRVPSLSSPDFKHLLPLERLHEFEAVHLFADRASLVRSGFTLTEANAAAVAQVCQRLDGIPLAIELAATRVKALPVDKLNERLHDMFRLLTGGSRTALPRQQTLRALIDWSYDLLSEPERALLRRLSVFAGGWTLEAAEAVCFGEGVEEWEVLDLLTSLVEKSLVLYEEREGEGRYRLLETVRQYGRDRLLEAGETEGVRERHRDWFLALSECDDEMPKETAWLDRLEMEHDNLRAALAWSGAQGHAEAGLRLVGALWDFWWMRGYWTEGRKHLSGLLALPGAQARTAARAKALLGVGHLVRDQGDYEAAWALHEESLAIYRELGDKPGIALSLRGLGLEAHEQGDLEAARALHEEYLSISRELGDQRLIAGALVHLGDVIRHQGNSAAARALWEESLAIVRVIGNKNSIACLDYRLGSAVHEQGESAAARALFEESLANFREVDNKHGIAVSLNLLGNVARDQGDYGEARALFEESLAISRELGKKRGIAESLRRLGQLARDEGEQGSAWALVEESLAIERELGDRNDIVCSLYELGMVAHARGEFETARALLEERLAISAELSHRPGIPENLEGLAAVAVAQAQPERAARLFGAAEGLREGMGAPLPPAERAEHERSVAAARTTLGEEAFAVAWAAGRAMSLEDAVAFALQDQTDA